MFEWGAALHIISQLRLKFYSSDVDLMIQRYVNKVVYTIFIIFVREQFLMVVVPIFLIPLLRHLNFLTLFFVSEVHL